MAKELRIEHGLLLKLRPERIVAVISVGSGSSFEGATLHKGENGSYLDLSASIQVRDVIRPIGEPLSPAQILKLAEEGARVRGEKLSETTREHLRQSAGKEPRTIITGR